MKITFAVLLLVSACAARQTDVAHENSDCKCVPYYQCSKVYSEGIVNTNNGLLDTAESSLKKCGHYLSVCCPEEEILSGDDDPAVEPPTGGSGGRPKPKPHVNRGCGYRNPDGVGFKITYNNEANFGEFPWMVAILNSNKVRANVSGAYMCGGSLIHPRVVLTGAHCVHGKSASDLTIRAGEWNTQSVNEPLPHQDRDVLSVITHEKFNYKGLANDFALLILEQPVELADNVEVVCLPEAHEYFDFQNCFASGWGKTQFGDTSKYQVILKAVELPVVPHDTCQDSLRKTRLGKYFKLDESFMCAGVVNGVDTCTGDGGSPLVCPLPNDPKRYTQAGIVAWGIGCGTDGVPGVYGSVATARQWIDQQFAKHNIDSSSYSPGVNNKYSPTN